MALLVLSNAGDGKTAPKATNPPTIIPKYPSGTPAICEIEEKAEDLVRTFESALKLRRRGSVVRLTVNDEISDDLLYFIQAQLDISKHDVFCFHGMIGLVDIGELVIDDRADLLFPPYRARFPERIRDYGGDCLAAIKAKDILVHHPYESFDVVV